MTPSDVLRMTLAEVEHQRDVTAAQFGELLVRLQRAFEVWEAGGEPGELLGEAAEIEEDLIGDWVETTRLARALGCMLERGDSPGSGVR